MSFLPSDHMRTVATDTTPNLSEAAKSLPRLRFGFATVACLPKNALSRPAPAALLRGGPTWSSTGLASTGRADYNPRRNRYFLAVSDKIGLREAVQNMTAYVTELWRLRHFWMALVRNDLRNRYRRSVLGLGWSLLQPIAMTAVLCTVFAGVFGVSLSEYAPYLLSGLTFWSFISAAAITGCQSFFQGESYIRQHRAPLAIYPLRTTLGAGYHFLVGMGVVLAGRRHLFRLPQPTRSC